MKKILSMMFICLITLIGICGLSLAFDQVVDHKAFEQQVLTKTNFYTFVRVQTTGIAEGLVPASSGRFRIGKGLYGLSGSATIVAPGLALTAAHVVVPAKVDIVMSGVSVWRTAVKNILQRNIFLFDYKSNPTIASIKHLDLEADVALLEFDHADFLKPVIGRPGYIRQFLKPLDVLAIVVHNRDKDDGHLTFGTHVIWGFCIDQGILLPYNPNGINPAPFWSLYDFTMNTPIQPGDSGSLVFAFEAGKPVWIGIANSIHKTDDGRFSSFAAWIPTMIHRLIGAME